MSGDLKLVRFLGVIAAALAVASPAVAYDTYGNGYGSKWGNDPNFGTGAVVTWGFMLDGTTLDPDGFPDDNAVTGTSNITALRNSVDTNYGSGAFNAAIERAFATWSAVANIWFVGPIADSGLPVGSPNANTPRIRIGAFPAVPGTWFDGAGAIGYGPPGPFDLDLYPLSGDIIFNVDGLGIQRPFQIAPGTEDVDPVDVFNFGDDVEGLFLHELGHAAIGLEHPRWAGENPDRRLMYVGDFTREDDPFCCTAINRQLHEDDVAGAQLVYGIRGDYNRNGTVDVADYVAWRKTNGSPVTSGTGADGNIDGTVDALDFDAWRSHFGNSTLAGFGEQQSMWSGNAVPEPTAGAVISLPLLLVSRPLRVRPRNKRADALHQYGRGY